MLVENLSREDATCWEDNVKVGSLSVGIKVGWIREDPNKAKWCVFFTTVIMADRSSMRASV